MILLVHDNGGHLKVSLSENVIGGERVKARTYEQEGKYLLIRADPNTQYHDVEELLKLGYRLAIASEQEEYVASKKKKRIIKESE